MTRMTLRAAALLGTLLAAGASAAPGQGPWGDLPASFVGDLPCADCPGIRHQIDLHPGGVYFLRREYLGRGSEALFDEIGTWSVTDGGRLLALMAEGRPSLFAIRDERRLRVLDREGSEIESALNYELERVGTLQPLVPHLEMSGMYRYMADAGIFVECLTGLRLPVAQEGDNAALERGYAEARSQPGAEVKVSVLGWIAPRPALVVERFLGAYPGETCGARGSVSSLEGTYWKLTRLGGAPIAVDPERREAHLVLDARERRVGGFDGCNRLMGSYTLAGDSLRFGDLAATRMACPDMATPEAMRDALARARTWRIAFHELELFDAAGKPVVRFEAREMP